LQTGSWSRNFLRAETERGIYNQIAGALREMPDVLKGADKKYTLKTMAGGGKAVKSKVKRVAKRKAVKK
jgi:hypothetical protein